MGSASETEYLLPLANELGLLNGDTYRRLSTDTEEIKRMLAALMAKLKADYGVVFTNPDKEPFIEASVKIINNFAKEKGIETLAAKIMNSAK